MRMFCSLVDEGTGGYLLFIIIIESGSFSKLGFLLFCGLVWWFGG